MYQCAAAAWCAEVLMYYLHHEFPLPSQPCISTLIKDKEISLNIYVCYRYTSDVGDGLHSMYMHAMQSLGYRACISYI